MANTFQQSNIVLFIGQVVALDIWTIFLFFLGVFLFVSCLNIGNVESQNVLCDLVQHYMTMAFPT